MSSATNRAILDPPSDEPDGPGLVVSLTFWLCLLLSAACFAAVSLSPKLLTYLRLRNQYVATQVRLVSLEQQVGQLQKVVESLERDSEYAAELARLDFDATRSDEEHIPVDQQLSLDARLTELSPTMPVVPLGWAGLFLEPLAQRAPLRRALLMISAVLVLLAFALLHEGRGERFANSLGGLWRGLGERYRRTDD